MSRTRTTRALVALILTVLLAGSAAPAAASGPGTWRGAWNWVFGVIFPWETPDLGFGIVPTVAKTDDGDKGAGIDPNGSTTTCEGDCGAGIDPNG